MIAIFAGFDIGQLMRTILRGRQRRHKCGASVCLLLVVAYDVVVRGVRDDDRMGRRAMTAAAAVTTTAAVTAATGMTTATAAGVTTTGVAAPAPFRKRETSVHER